LKKPYLGGLCFNTMIPPPFPQFLLKPLYPPPARRVCRLLL
jgi:hypothetical protein